MAGTVYRCISSQVLLLMIILSSFLFRIYDRFRASLSMVS